jgi:hypothetical protein
VVRLSVCEKPHGSPTNSATVYGHHASVRVCIRLFGTRMWMYDPRFETEREEDPYGYDQDGV